MNAADNKQRDSKMENLWVTIDRSTGMISVKNDGATIPIQRHKEYDMYVAELLFGELLTSDNYDDNEKRVVGGRNGYGAKLANIFSSKFQVVTCDGKTKLTCRWSDSMRKKELSVKEPSSEKSFTEVTFYPAWHLFGMPGMTTDIEKLFSRRVYDMVGTVKKCKIWFNGKQISLKGFEAYASLYLPDPPPCPVDGSPGESLIKKFVSINFADRWEILVGECKQNYPNQVSFVNSICTSKGGTHVDLIVNQIVKAIQKKHVNWKPQHIKSSVCIFINCLIENPSFDSQTKTHLTSRPATFGSDPTFTDKQLKAILASGIEAAVNRINELSEDKTAARALNVTISSGRLNIPKLDDANYAGTAKWKDCTLILTEGDSAKTSCLAGLSIVGRDRYGVFPLRGKLLNVRDVSLTTMIANQEIKNLLAILGLKYGQEPKNMRYGSVMIMTDQDPDGSHIKGLIVNLFHKYWPMLLKKPGFLKQFVTPLVKVRKGQTEIAFYSSPQYDKWAIENNNGKGWFIKYYKGLGTSTDREFKEYFLRLNNHQIDFEYSGALDDEKICMVFSKDRAEDRKRWIESYADGTFFDCKSATVTYTDFIDKELILFSRYDVVRSVPSLIDGFKPGQRKVLFAAFKRGMTSEVKVAQFAAYVAEHSCYHHGETSLQSTIINMAQTFVGTNNINLFYPGGQFGSRKEGGKDASAARYIFTRLMNLTRLIFPASDDPLLKYQNEEGVIIEPHWYCPVIPMVLINGAEGIGTGWSTSVPNYCPKDIIINMKRLLRGMDYVSMTPKYRGFQGEIVPKKTGDSYDTVGTYEWLDELTLRVTELPIKTWTQTYKEFLDSLLPDAVDQQIKLAATVKAKAKAKVVKAKMTKKTKKEFVGEDEDQIEAETAPAKLTFQIENYTDNSSNAEVCFTISVTKDMKSMFLSTKEELEKNLKLKSSVSTSNLTLFNADGKIYRFSSEKDILFEFMIIRHEKYVQRKASLLANLGFECNILENKCRFIKEIISGKLIVSNRKRADLLKELQDKQYDTMSTLKTKHRAPTVPKGELELANEAAEHEVEFPDEIQESQSIPLAQDYHYLLSLAIWTLTKEKVENLEKETQKKKAEQDEIRRTSVEQMWDNDLNAILKQVIKMEDEDAKLLEMERSTSKKAKELIKKAGGKKVLIGSPGAKKPKAKAKRRSKDSEDEIFDSDGEDSDVDVFNVDDLDQATPLISKFMNSKQKRGSLDAVSVDDATLGELASVIHKLPDLFLDVMRVSFKPFEAPALPSSFIQAPKPLKTMSNLIKAETDTKFAVKSLKSESLGMFLIAEELKRDIDSEIKSMLSPIKPLSKSKPDNPTAVGKAKPKLLKQPVAEAKKSRGRAIFESESDSDSVEIDENFDIIEDTPQVKKRGSYNIDDSDEEDNYSNHSDQDDSVESYSNNSSAEENDDFETPVKPKAKVKAKAKAKTQPKSKAVSAGAAKRKKILESDDEDY